MISDPSRRISACSKPTALLAASSDRKELEQTSSARESVRCACVIRVGRISCRTTGTPALAACQAASEPARPAPTMCTVSEGDLVPVISRQVAPFPPQWNVRPTKNDNARVRRALSVRHWADGRSAVVVPGCNARNVRAIKADVGQFAIAELGQFADIALIVPERLDHADEREQHGSLLVVSIQPLEESLIVEMNIGQHTALRKFRCCGAAKSKTHSADKDRLTFRHSCWIDRPEGPISTPKRRKRPV